MTMKDEKATKVKTPVFRVSFPAVFSPKENNMGGEPKFSITMLFDKNDAAVMKGLEAMKAAVRAAVVEKWGADKAKWPKGLRLPFRDGTEKDYDGYGPNVIFCSATSKMRPQLFDQNVQPIMEPSEFYGGCYAMASLNAYAYDVSGNRGVAFGLRGVQKVKDGEAFGGGGSVEKDFAPIDGGAVESSKAEEVTGDPLGL